MIYVENLMKLLKNTVFAKVTTQTQQSRYKWKFHGPEYHIKTKTTYNNKTGSINKY